MCWFKPKSNLKPKKGVRELFLECNGYLHRFEIEALGKIADKRFATSYMSFQVYNHRLNKHTKFVLKERPGHVYLDTYTNDDYGNHYSKTIKVNRLQDFTKEIYDAKI